MRYQLGVGVTLYINGVNVGTAIAGSDVPLTVSSASLTVGANYAGILDEFKIYSNALSDEEISDIFQEESWPFEFMASNPA